MCFYHILHKNSNGHLLRTPRDSFRSPPKVLEKKWTIFYYIFMYIFEEYVLCLSYLSKIWPKNIDFYRYSYNVGERAVQRAVFAPPPFTSRSN